MGKPITRRAFLSLDTLEDRLVPTVPVGPATTGPMPPAVKSAPNSSFNEIIFIDKKGSEQITIHTVKDQTISVENDETHWVGHDRTKSVDRDETITIHHDRTETVDKGETITIHGSRTETVDKEETITIRRDRTETVDKDETITIHGSRIETVDKDEAITIHINRTETVDKNETIIITNGPFTLIGNDTKADGGGQATPPAGESGKDDIFIFDPLTGTFRIVPHDRPLTSPMEQSPGGPSLQDLFGPTTLFEITKNADGSTTTITRVKDGQGNVIDETKEVKYQDGSSTTTITHNDYFSDFLIHTHATTTHVQKMPDGSQTTTVYDGQGKETSRQNVKTENDGSVTTTDYDPKGNVTKKTNAKTENDGSVTTTDYDTKGNTTKKTNVKTNADGSKTTTTAEYDEKGNIIKSGQEDTPAPSPNPLLPLFPFDPLLPIVPNLPGGTTNPGDSQANVPVPISLSAQDNVFATGLTVGFLDPASGGVLPPPIPTTPCPPQQ
jgi:hypothetical protein